MYDYVLLIRFEVGSLYSRYKFQSQSSTPISRARKATTLVAISILKREERCRQITGIQNPVEIENLRIGSIPETPEDGPKYLSFSIENPCFLAKKVYTTIEVCVKLDMF